MSWIQRSLRVAELVKSFGGSSKSLDDFRYGQNVPANRDRNRNPPNEGDRDHCLISTDSQRKLKPSYRVRNTPLQKITLQRSQCLFASPPIKAFRQSVRNRPTNRTTLLWVFSDGCVDDFVHIFRGHIHRYSDTCEHFLFAFFEITVSRHHQNQVL